ncbi:MAG: hypothetical protein A2461_03330 [Burkholderiales bacterium RIFOXYC2_FULL_59_8]|nr:MAG: hypothetical protein A2461_03330 [Burkholderiales bacterium RIFOXYC2_FULL_59_8]OGB81500.1 MAG: hypothetical protein A2496_23750 [Burkholderiales bacterium RIFOXYC12_FULL_60_6]OGB83492.1 MAG: hypothetical protein A2535_08925 [Burkholderiales bacterium RIFOXYD2_FULL_59_8]
MGHGLIKGIQTMNKRIYNIFAIVLLALFFLPVIWKLKQWDLAILLLGGLALPIYDFLNPVDDK